MLLTRILMLFILFQTFLRAVKDLTTYAQNLLIETTPLTLFAFYKVTSVCRVLKGEIGINGFKHFDENAFAVNAEPSRICARTFLIKFSDVLILNEV